MRNRKLQNEKLDRFGRELLAAARISNDEIEQIVAAPHLFNSVKARINTEQRERKSKNFSGNRWNSPVWNWQRVSVAFAGMAIFVFGVFGFIVMNKFSQNEDQFAAVPEIQPEWASVKVAETPQIQVHSRETAKKEGSIIKPFFKQAAFKKDIVKTRKALRKNDPPKKSNPVEKEPVKEFYALNYIGNPNETGEALRVVRTELSRSELFAMGVNLPIENEPKKVKTDLLVGTDGVARAIRFVE